MSWFKVVNMSGGQSGEPRIVNINIHGPIGKDYWDDSSVSANAFINAVEALGAIDTIKVSLATPGGNFFDGIAIANYLKGHKATVEIEILSEASSAGSAIAMGASPGKLKAYAASYMMIHDPATYAQGNASALRELADKLDTLKAGMLSLYTSRTGKSDDEIWKMLTDETLMTSEQALADGFIDEIIETDMPVTNCNLPERKDIKAEAMDQITKLSKKKSTPPQINVAEETINLCAENKLVFMAAGLIKEKLTLEQVKAKVKLASDVRDICTAGGIENSEQIITNMNSPLEMVRQTIMNVKASLDEDIDGGLGQPKDKKQQIKNSWKKAIASS